MSLVCNAFPSQNILEQALKLDFNMKKVEVPTKEELIFLYNTLKVFIWIHRRIMDSGCLR
jgi:hypothetical protein